MSPIFYTQSIPIIETLWYIRLHVIETWVATEKEKETEVKSDIKMNGLEFICRFFELHLRRFGCTGHQKKFHKNWKLLVAWLIEFVFQTQSWNHWTSSYLLKHNPRCLYPVSITHGAFNWNPSVLELVRKSANTWHRSIKRSLNITTRTKYICRWWFCIYSSWKHYKSVD